tara:strand:+ start:133 stop:486 length:354 start_codon:yes stop_codon:yes gene_type:complete
MTDKPIMTRNELLATPLAQLTPAQVALAAECIKIRLPARAAQVLRDCEQWANEDGYPPAVTVLRCVQGSYFSGPKSSAAVVARQARYWTGMAEPNGCPLPQQVRGLRRIAELLEAAC